MEGKELKKLIDDKGIKQTFIARKLGVSKTLITQWVTGDRPIADKHVPMLNEILK